MPLTPEEKRKIYEEEKVRLEEQKKLKEEENAKETKGCAKGCGYGLLVTICIVVIFFIVNSLSPLFESDKVQDPETVEESLQRSPKSVAPILTYDIVDRDIDDSPIKTQIETHAVVSGTITELSLKQLLQKMYDEASATRGFKHYGGVPTHVFIYLYTSEDHFKSGMGQWIAMLSKVGENSRIDTQIRTDLIAQLHAKPEVKHGLAEPKRKEIFGAIVTAEDRADKDAQRMYPIPDPLEPGYSRDKVGTQWTHQIEAFRSLKEKYRAQVAKRYGITEEQLRDISIEGVTNNWPIPTMP